MFCQCYFNTEPAAHSGHGDQGAATTEHFCKFNIAYQVNEGHYGETKLQGARFWIAGDLGHDFSEMETDWAVLTFDPGTSPEAREALGQIIPKIYPFKWRSFSMGEDAEVVWEMTDSGSHASLDGGKAGEIVLNASPGMGGEPKVLKNMPYMGAARNEGFIMMPNTIETYCLGDNAFEFKGSTGFMITLDLASQDYQ